MKIKITSVPKTVKTVKIKKKTPGKRAYA